MNVVNYPEQQNQTIGATGNCPHCNVISLLRPVTSYTEIGLVASITRCESRKKFALVVRTRSGQHQGCSVQQSAIELQAKGGRLIDQIDDLQKQGKITEALKDFAHEVRLTGNDGAHPDRDGLADVVEGDSKLIMEFTQEYLHHVYVMPAKLAARRTPTVAATSV
jgi:hypothetical protein